MFFIIVWLPLHTCMDNDRDKYCKYNDMDDIMICSPLHICTDNDFKDNHCNYNDKNDIMIIIPLHLCTDTPCHLPTWTAPPCNWPKDQKIKFSLQLSQKGFCSYFKRFYFYFSSPILVRLRIPTVVKVTFWQICKTWS